MKELGRGEGERGGGWVVLLEKNTILTNRWLQVVDYGINKVWERNNTGVGLYLESFYSDTLFFRLQFLVFAF